MKKIFASLVLIVFTVTFSSCEKDSFNYDLNSLYGKWRITHVDTGDGSGYFDITTIYAEPIFGKTYATFNPDKTYYGSGYFGTGSGTYTAIDNTITTYIDGEEYYKYDVISFSGSQCELKMYRTGKVSTINIKCQKQ